MNTDRRKFEVGDRVATGTGAGTIIALLAERRFHADLNGKDWEFLNEGMLVLDDVLGIIHIPDPEGIVTLLEEK
jgi:hypothetical protein